MIDLRLGDWRTALADVVGDVLICDPPYGERTHQANGERVTRYDGRDLSPLAYQYMRPEDVVEFCAAWRERIRGWWCVFSCHDLSPVWLSSFEKVGLYSFAPIACVATIIDPFAGSATTLIAASGLGRNAIGAEIDEAAWKMGKARIERGVQLELS